MCHTAIYKLSRAVDLLTNIIQRKRKFRNIQKKKKSNYKKHFSKQEGITILWTFLLALIVLAGVVWGVQGDKNDPNMKIFCNKLTFHRVNSQ